MSANGKKSAARKTGWKSAAALAISNFPETSLHEREVCGVFCGLIDHALSVFSSYQDELWAHLSAHLGAAFEKILSGATKVLLSDDSILQAFRDRK